jgi:protein-tyrosine phosphatase
VSVRILFVCLGNICRSPTAEGVVRRLLADVPGIEIELDSAGTGAYHVGDPPDPRSQRAALLRGVDLSGLRARRVSARDFADFDLILAMDRSNLRDLQAMRPRASRAQLRLFMEYAGDLEDLEVPDPYGGDSQDFERVLDLSEAAGRGLIAALQNRSQ